MSEALTLARPEYRDALADHSKVASFFGSLDPGNPAATETMRIAMNWDQVEGRWKQVRGSLKQTWVKLTENDLDYIAGRREQFIGKLQKRYGIAKEEAQKQAEELVKMQHETEARQTGRP